MNHINASHYSGRRFLVIDDEANMLLMLKKVLESGGAEVDTVSCEKEALKLAEQNHYDLTLIDVEIDRENGLDLVRRLLRIVPSMNAVLITGSASMFLEKIVEDLGIKGFLLKPLDIAVLHQKISGFMV